MVLIKRFIFGSIALIFIAMGGFGTQSNNLILQCGGVIGIIIGLVVIYIFGKMAWRAMGCIPSLLVLIIILLFVLYAIGGFTDGIGGVGKNVQSFFGHGIDSSEDVLVNMNVKQEVEKTKSTELDNQKRDDGVINLIGEDEHPILTENFLPKQKKKEEKSFNPMDYPAMEGVSNAIFVSYCT